MKKFVIVLQLVMLIAVSCNPPEDNNIGDDGITIIDTKVIPLGYSRTSNDLDTIGVSYGCERGDSYEFRTLEFEKAYVFTSYEQYLQAMSADEEFVDVNVANEVDFSYSSIVAVTGLASSYVKKLEHKFYYKAKSGKYHLDIYVDVADTCRVAHKWNLLLKVPCVMTDNDKVECTITTNQKLIAVEPDYTTYDGRFRSILSLNRLPKRDEDYCLSRKGIAPYTVIFKPENYAEIVRLVNEHPTASLYYRGGSGPLRPVEYFGGLWMDIIYCCEYADFIEPNLHLFEKVYNSSYYSRGGFDYQSITMLPLPLLYLKNILIKNKELLTPLMNHIGKGIYSDSPVEYIVFDENKIHYIDFLTIILRYYSDLGIANLSDYGIIKWMETYKLANPDYYNKPYTIQSQ